MQSSINSKFKVLENLLGDRDTLSRRWVHMWIYHSRDSSLNELGKRPILTYKDVEIGNKIYNNSALTPDDSLYMQSWIIAKIPF